MADEGKTKIVFSGGAEITVAHDAREVRRLLSEDRVKHEEPFTAFKSERGDDVYVAVEQVAYVEQAQKYQSASF
jgi:hypothetical protein